MEGIWDKNFGIKISDCNNKIIICIIISSYGTWTRGARILNLDLVNDNDDDEIKLNTQSYIRMETGDIIDHFPIR